MGSHEDFATNDTFGKTNSGFSTTIAGGHLGDAVRRSSESGNIRRHARQHV
jgi:hypothetical protein